jgi:hypothetical protein
MFVTSIVSDALDVQTSEVHVAVKVVVLDDVVHKSLIKELIT